MSSSDFSGFEDGAERIRQAVEAAWGETLLVMTREYTQTISTPGIFPGYAGDIVDSGFFRASLNNPSLSGRPQRGRTYSNDPKRPELTRDGGDLVGLFVWHAEYSLALHEGTTTISGRGRQGRPWTKVTHDRVNVQNVFETIFRRQMGLT